MEKAARRGPRPMGSDTKADILGAATRLFSEFGFEAVSMRAVAREAGVDPALVSYYFGSKGGLFIHAMRPSVDVDQVNSFIAEVDPAECGTALLSFALEFWGDLQAAQRMAGTLAAANSQPSERDFLRELLFDGFMLPIARRVSPDEPELRATLASTVLLGMITCAATLRMPMMDGLSDARLAEALGAQCQALLTGPLPPEEHAVASPGELLGPSDAPTGLPGVDNDPPQNPQGDVSS